MNENTEANQERETEVQHWVNRLLTSTGQEKQQAAAQLSRLGVWTRGSIRTRGSLRAPAQNRLPEPEKLPDVVRCLQDTDKGVRCQVALALGEWGNEEAARVLSQLLQTETDEEVQLYCVTALRTIGGPLAAEGLRQAAENGTEAVRDAAITAIEELVTGGPVDDTEGAAVPQQHTPSVVRTRGAVRARGVVRTRGGKRQREVDNIAATLQRISADGTVSDYVRQRAAQVLAYVAE